MDWLSGWCKEDNHRACPRTAVGPTVSYQCVCPCHTPRPGPGLKGTPGPKRRCAACGYEPKSWADAERHADKYRHAHIQLNFGFVDD